MTIGAGALYGASARRVPARRGELDGNFVAQRVGGLQHALAERRGAQDDGAIVVLEGSSNQLSGAGCAVVHQQGQTQVVPATGLPSQIHLGVL